MKKADTSFLKNERIAVLAGGTSCERDISLLSGQAVFEALSSQGLPVSLLDPARDFIDQLKKQRITVAFIALHGTFGEDGTVQRMLEEADISYTGPGPSASEAAFHKSKSQPILREAGIPVPEFVVVTKKDAPAASALRMPLPVVVKPSAAGSSVGISIIFNEGELSEACEEAFRYSDEVLIERYVSGRELTVAILGDEPLPIVEVIVRRRFYDYEAKYHDPATRYECPAELDPVKARRVTEMALRAHRALGCEILSRADVVLGEEGNAYLLELNTVPGLTGKSLLPKAAKASGVDFSDLCVRILELSLKKRRVSWSGR